MLGTDRRAHVAATVALAIVLAIVTFTAPKGLVGGDEGVKLIQAFGVLEYGLADPKLPYPARRFDPEERNHPVVPPHVIARGGDRYGIYPITFTAPSAAAWRLGGFWALHVLPLVGGILAVLMTMRLAWLLTADRWWSVAAGVLLVVATPMTVYAATFNEHALGVGVFMAGIVGSATAETRRGQLAAGAALGLAATLRGELMAAAPAMTWFVVAYHGWSRETRRRAMWIGVGALVVLAAFCAYNAATTGAALPGVVANRDANRPRSWMVMVSLLFERRAGGGPPPMLVLGAILALGVLALRGPGRRSWPWYAAAGALVLLWCWYAGLALREVTPGTGRFRTAIGLFSSAPFLVVAGLVGLAPPDDRRRRVVAVVGAAVLFVVAVFLTNADGQAGGLQFGARHLLLAAPLLTVGAVAVVRGIPARFAVLAVVPLVLSVFGAVQNLRAWHTIAGRNAALTAAAARSPSRDIVSNFFWGPEVIAPLWLERRISLATALTEPLRRMRAAGVTEITQVMGGLARYEREGRLEPIATIDARNQVIRYRIVK